MQTPSEQRREYPATKQEARALGLRFYCTGKPCKDGHITTRYANNGHCLSCSKVNGKKWFSANRERKNELWRNWVAANPERRKAHKNTTVKIETKRKWARANIEKCRQSGRNYYRRNPEHFKTKRRNRYARQSAAEGKHSVSDVRQILREQRGRCAYCRAKLGKGRHVDHIIALANGGTNDRTNLQILCGPCNLSKGSKHPLHFARQLGMLL